MRHHTTTRALAWTSLLGLIIAVVATVIGHLGLGPGFDPLTLTVSDYALSDRGGAIEVAMVALSAGSLALLFGLGAVRAPVRGLPRALMLVWCGGLLIAAVVPTDPLTVTTMSTAGYIHRYASVTGFVCLPIAVAILAARFRVLPHWARLSTLLRRLAVLCAFGLAVFWYVAFPGGRVMMGLVERCLLGVEVTMLMALSVALISAVRSARPVRRTARVTAPAPTHLAHRVLGAVSGPQINPAWRSPAIPVARHGDLVGRATHSLTR